MHIAGPQRDVRATVRRARNAAPCARARPQGRSPGGVGTVLHSATTVVVVPAVVRLTRFVRVPLPGAVPLTRRAVFARDGGRCVYCGGNATSIDHVVPRSRGGQHIWDNVVSACQPVQPQQGRPDLAELGWRLRVTPRQPAGTAWRIIGTGRADPCWAPYLTPYGAERPHRGHRLRATPGRHELPGEAVLGEGRLGLQPLDRPQWRPRRVRGRGPTRGSPRSGCRRRPEVTERRRAAFAGRSDLDPASRLWSRRRSADRRSMGTRGAGRRRARRTRHQGQPLPEATGAGNTARGAEQRQKPTRTNITARTRRTSTTTRPTPPSRMPRPAPSCHLIVRIVTGP